MGLAPIVRRPPTETFGGLSFQGVGFARVAAIGGWCQADLFLEDPGKRGFRGIADALGDIAQTVCPLPQRLFGQFHPPGGHVLHRRDAHLVAEHLGKSGPGDPRLARKIMPFGENKIALGTDYPFPLGELSPGKLIENMDFDQRTRERLFHGTALEWLGVSAERFQT